MCLYFSIIVMKLHFLLLLLLQGKLCLFLTVNGCFYIYNGWVCMGLEPNCSVVEYIIGNAPMFGPSLCLI